VTVTIPTWTETRSFPLAARDSRIDADEKVVIIRLMLSIDIYLLLNLHPEAIVYSAVVAETPHLATAEFAGE
jgi:hypothetical protein